MAVVAELDGDVEHSALLTFEQPFGWTMESINDEVFEGHPFHGKGLDLAGPFVVRNSRWKQRMGATMELHPQHDAELWSRWSISCSGTRGDLHCLATGVRFERLHVTVVELRERVALWLRS